MSRTPGKPAARRRPLRALVLALAALAVLVTSAACSSGGSAPESPGELPPGTVVITGMQFQPAEITVHAGDTVTWRFRDSGVPHDVTSTDADGSIAAQPVLDSGQKKTGEYTHTFTEPGRYTYICTLHPDMKGVVIVEP